MPPQPERHQARTTSPKSIHGPDAPNLRQVDDAGLTKVETAADATSGREVVLNPANWTVTKMEPKAGTQIRTDQTVVVTMTK